MNQIQLLSEDTIDKIAAGEVIERPASVVKELVENAIDAGAGAVTVEIKEGGLSLIRITDNGEGIPREQIPTAFLRHATSKIKKVEDLLHIGSLGFRGEALSSIAAVCQVELITKTAGSLTGVRYVIEGSREKSMEEIGAPEGSTFLVRNIFYNTPARKKFLKSPVTEAGYVSDLMEHLALSHPEISFKFINNGQTRLHTSGNCNLKDIIYSIYGREIASNLVEIKRKDQGVSITGFIGKPLISRGNRNFENYFVNGRYVKSQILSKAIEEGYKTFLMQHRYPFTVLRLQMDGSMLDINVHPTKMELRFADNEGMYQLLCQTVKDALAHKDLIPKVSFGKEEASSEYRKKMNGVPQNHEVQTAKKRESYPEPFEKVRRTLLAESQSPYQPKYKENFFPVPEVKPLTENRGTAVETGNGSLPFKRAGSGNIPCEKALGSSPKPGPSESETNKRDALETLIEKNKGSCSAGSSARVGAHLQQNSTAPQCDPAQSAFLSDRNFLSNKEKNRQAPDTGSEAAAEEKTVKQPCQMELFDRKLLSRDSVPEHKLIGQVFDTYWLVQFQDHLYIIDQHAAHEKVMYERLTKSLKTREFTTQRVSPPIILSLSMQEENLLHRYESIFQEIGFEIEHFGGREYSICGVPDNLFGLTDRRLFLEMLDSLSDHSGQPNPETLNEKLASMACKSAVKGNSRLSVSEANALIQELLELENPYNCPHGRPTIISMSKYDLEKKFKRIV